MNNGTCSQSVGRPSLDLVCRQPASRSVAREARNLLLEKVGGVKLPKKLPVGVYKYPAELFPEGIIAVTPLTGGPADASCVFRHCNTGLPSLHKPQECPVEGIIRWQYSFAQGPTADPKDPKQHPNCIVLHEITPGYEEVDGIVRYMVVSHEIIAVALCSADLELAMHDLALTADLVSGEMGLVQRCLDAMNTPYGACVWKEDGKTRFIPNTRIRQFMRQLPPKPEKEVKLPPPGRRLVLSG